MLQSKKHPQQSNRTEKTTAYLSYDALKRCESSMLLLGLKSRSTYIEQAVNFYSGYLQAQAHSDYLSAAVTKAIEGAIENTENRLARMMFKEAVELAKLTSMLADINEMDDDEIERLHYKCVQEVKRINGMITFEDIIKRQKSKKTE